MIGTHYDMSSETVCLKCFNPNAKLSSSLRVKQYDLPQKLYVRDA